MGLESDNVERAGLVTAVEQAADGIVITDIDGRIQYVNPAFSAMTGYSRLEVLGQNPRVLKSGRHPKGFYEGLWGTLRSGQVWHGVLTNRRKDGSLYDEEMRIAPVRNVDGGVSGYIAIKRDVTEQKAAEESRRFLASIVETSDDAIISYSPVGTILTWNQGAEEIFGYRTLEVVGKHVSFLAPSERHSNIAQTLESLLSGELMQLRQGLGLHKDGRKIPVSIRSSVIKSSSGEVIAISDIVRDVSKLQEAEKKYRDIFNGAIEGIFQHELTGKPLAVNPALARTLGYDSPEELVSLVKDVTKDVWLDPDLHAQLSRRADEHGVVRGMECQLKRKDGSVIWASISGHRVHNELGREPYLEGFLEDITERKRGEEALHLSEERYRTVFQMNLDGIAITRLSDGMVVDVNKAFLDLMGYDRGEVFGNTTVGLGMWVDLDDRKNWAEVLLATSAVRDLKVRLKRKNGDVFWSLNSSAVIEIDGASCVLTIVRDVSAAQAAEEEIKSLAFYDTLTGLPNRRLVSDRLRHALAAGIRNHQWGALLFIDLDEFKKLNDTLGHKTGDLLLQETAGRLTACTRTADTVARLGGDEFVIILEDLGESPEIAATIAKVVAEKILSSLAQPYLLDGHECPSTSSIGITLFGDRIDGIDDILQQADIAMYHSKGAGRNTVRFFAPALQVAITARVALEDELRNAIKTNQFLLHYQPQVDHGRLTGVEALVRWKHPKRGIVFPDEFIPLAEETGLIVPIGSWVLETACRQIAEWTSREETSHVSVAVNISAREFCQPDFEEHVLRVLKRTSANPRNLTLELTESMLVNNVEEVIAKMTSLKSLGVRFSLDDFGMGYSSLSYLKRLPLDQLKIDRAFVRDMMADSSSGAIVKTIIVLSQAFGLSVIAEGLETEEQRAFLIGLGCHSFQGFLYSKPLPSEELNQWNPIFAS